MRVVSWNVWWRFGGQWRARQHAIAATLRDLDPDVVGLQEVWATEQGSQADLLAAELGLHAVFAGPSLPPPPDPPEAPDQTGVEVGVAVLSRWPVRDHRVAPLPARHRHPPVALVASIEHPAGPLHVVTACVEWEPAFADDQRAQSRALADLIGRPDLDGPLPVVLAADLNGPPDAEELRPLLEVATDTWAAGGGDPRAVTLPSSHPLAPREAARQIDRRVDYVLARPGTSGGRLGVDRAFLAGDPVDGCHPSDHRAVVVDIEP